MTEIATVEAELRSPRKRVGWIDISKGIAIGLVVFGHALRGAHDSGVPIDPYVFERVDNAIYLFHMPLFFFLSGLTFNLEQSGTVLLRKLSARIVYPYFVWSFLLISAKLIFFKSANHPASPFDYIETLYDPISPFWFLYALFLVQLGTKLLDGAVRPGLVALVVVGLFGSYYAFDFGRFAALEFTHFLLFFAIGVAWAKKGPGKPTRSVNTGVMAALLLAFGLASLVASLPGYGTLVGGLVSIALVIGFAAAFQGKDELEGPLDAGLAYLGRRSMEVFCMHVFIAAAIRSPVTKLLPGTPLLAVVVVAGAAIFLSLAAAYVLQAMKVSRFLGLPMKS